MVGELGRDVRADPQPGQPFAAQHGQFRADLEQAVRQPEEERAERDPEHDHRGRPRIRVRRIERARAEQHREHRHDHHGRTRQHGDREPVVQQQRRSATGEQRPLAHGADARPWPRPLQRPTAPSLGLRRALRATPRVARAHRRPPPRTPPRPCRPRTSRHRAPGSPAYATCPPGGQEHDLVAAEEVGEDMGGQDDGGAVLGQGAQGPQQGRPGDRIEPGGGFVEEEHPRSGEQLGGDTRPFAFTAAQRTDRRTGPVGQPERVQDPVDGRGDRTRPTSPAACADPPRTPASGAAGGRGAGCPPAARTRTPVRAGPGRAPSCSTEPSPADRSPASVSSSTVLPAPLLPAITTIRPGAASRDTSSSTRPAPRTSWVSRRARIRRPSTGARGVATGGRGPVGIGMEAACQKTTEFKRERGQCRASAGAISGDGTHP